MTADIFRFDEACTKLVNTGIVTASGHVTAVLKVIAGSPKILEVIKTCCANYNFEAEFNRSKVPNGMNDYRLMLPTDPKEFVAYAFGVLYRIDLGDLNLTNMLSTYYRAADFNASFLLFATEIVDRFRCTVENMLNGSSDGQGTDCDAPRAAIRDGEAVNELCEGLSEALDVLKDCAEEIDNAALPQPEKAEYLTVTDGFKKVLTGDDATLVRAYLIAFRKTFAATPFAHLAEAVQLALSRHGLI